MEKIKIGIRVPDRLKNLIAQKSEKQGISMNALILQILWNWVEKDERRQK